MYKKIFIMYIYNKTEAKIGESIGNYGYSPPMIIFVMKIK